MLFLFTGDLHLTDKTPINRIDDYEKTILNKFQFILDTGKQYKVDCILQPGDFTDYPHIPYSLFSDIAKRINTCGINWIVIRGQHDLHYRREENNAVDALCNSVPNINFVSYLDNLTYNIYGASYGKEIPIVEDHTKFNILLIHKMIIGNDKLWDAQKDYVTANNLLRKQKYFNVILSGDNHQSFITEHKGRYLFNCGSMMRSNVSQVNHKPFIIVFDTDNPAAYKKIFIPIELPEKVFDFSKVKLEKEQTESLNVFVEGLSEQKELKFTFMDNLLAYAKLNNISKEITDIILDCAGGK